MLVVVRGAPRERCLIASSILARWAAGILSKVSLGICGMSGIAGIPWVSVVVVVSHRPSLASMGFKSAAAASAARAQAIIRVLTILTSVFIEPSPKGSHDVGMFGNPASRNGRVTIWTKTY